METINNSDVREAAFNSYAGAEHCTVFTEERKWMNKILKWKELYPNEVTIQNHDTEFGSMVALVPQSWMKMSPKRKDTLTEEQIQAARERMKLMRKNSRL